MSTAAKTKSKSALPARRANLLSGGEWLQHSFSIWRDLGKNGEERGLSHPAMFTVALVSRLIDAYTCGEGTLLDPFAGAGTSLLAALNKNMSAIGLDVNPEFRKLFAKRASPFFDSGQWEYHTRDACDMKETIAPESIDICVTSPPYWDILNRRRSADGKAARPYSDLTSDIGNLSSYPDFIAALGNVISGVRAALKPGGYFILNVMDLRKGPKFYPLHIDAAAEAARHGFTLEDIIIWDRQGEYNNLRPLGYPHKFIVNKVHEYLLVLR